MIAVAQLIVRNIEEEVVRALKQRAASRGVSTEAEHRDILRRTLLGHSSRSFKQALLAMPNLGRDHDFVAARGIDRRVDLASAPKTKRSTPRKRAKRSGP